MYKQLFAAATIALAANAQDNGYTNTEEEMEIMKHDKMESSLRNYDAFRGAWLGFNRGLYKQTSWKDMESKCMDGDIRKRWIEAYSVWLGVDTLDDDVDMLTAFGDVLLIFANLTECRFR